MPTPTAQDHIRFDPDSHLAVDTLTAWLAGLPGDAKITLSTEVGMHAEAVPVGLTATYRPPATPNLIRTPPSPDPAVGRCRCGWASHSWTLLRHHIARCPQEDA